MGYGQAGHNGSWWATRLRPDQPAWLSSLDEWDSVCAWHPWAVQVDPIGKALPKASQNISCCSPLAAATILQALSASARGMNLPCTRSKSRSLPFWRGQAQHCWNQYCAVALQEPITVQEEFHGKDFTVTGWSRHTALPLAALVHECRPVQVYTAIVSMAPFRDAFH